MNDVELPLKESMRGGAELIFLKQGCSRKTEKEDLSSNGNFQRACSASEAISKLQIASSTHIIELLPSCTSYSILRLTSHSSIRSASRGLQSEEASI